ncbi:hypothetical protein DsansV1_C10g0105561 [Dioscorea sansibarensis]
MMNAVFLLLSNTELMKKPLVRNNGQEIAGNDRNTQILLLPSVLPRQNSHCDTLPTKNWIALRMKAKATNGLQRANTWCIFNVTDQIVSLYLVAHC